MSKIKYTAILFAILEEHNLIKDDFEELIKIIPKSNGKIIENNNNEILASFSSFDVGLEVSLELQELFLTKNIKTKMGLHLTSKSKKNINIAKRLAEKAKKEELLLTEAFVEELSPHLKSKTIFISKIIGNDNNTINIYALEQKNYNDTVKNIKLLLSYKNKETILIGFSDYIIGKKTDCDLIIQTNKISEHHAIIIKKQGTFIIKDISENGTYIKPISKDEVYINNKEIALSDTGLISLGDSFSSNNQEILKYKVIKS